MSQKNLWLYCDPGQWHSTVILGNDAKLLVLPNPGLKWTFHFKSHQLISVVPLKMRSYTLAFDNGMEWNQTGLTDFETCILCGQDGTRHGKVLWQLDKLVKSVLLWKVHSLKLQGFSSLQKDRQDVNVIFRFSFLGCVFFPQTALLNGWEKSHLLFPLTVLTANCCLRWIEINFWKVFEVPAARLFCLLYLVITLAAVWSPLLVPDE